MIRVFGNKLGWFAAVWVVFFLSACSSSENTTSKKSLKQDALGHRPGPQGFKTVIIDAGHGGKDSGASGCCGVKEKDLTLDTAKRLQKKLRGHFKTVMIRRNDRFVELDDRVAKANRYDSAVLVSLHYNYSRSCRPRGPETYYWRVDSYSLGKRIEREVAKVSPREVGSRGLVRRRLRLTRNPKIPSVLVELGYISNYSEAKLCMDSKYRDKMAAAVARGIIAQKKYGDQGMGRLPRPITKPLSKASDRPGS